MKIIYPSEEGGVHILLPSNILPIEEIAKKDVPPGVPYKIVEDSEIPTDRTFRNAWEIDMSLFEPDGYGLGHEAWAKEQEAKK